MTDLEFELNNLIVRYTELEKTLSSELELLRANRPETFQSYSSRLDSSCQNIDACQENIRRLLATAPVDRTHGERLTDLKAQANTLRNRLLKLSAENEIAIKERMKIISRQLGEMFRGLKYLKSLGEMMPVPIKLVDSSR